jgi:hypothetical protein
MGVIDSIGKVFQWRKELPTPIYYFFIPPRPQLFPKEITVKLDGEPDVWTSWIGIENMSDRVLKDIRIKIPVKLLYDPVVYARQWEIDHITNEIDISTIDPKETAYITIFTHSKQAKKFTKPKVIIGDQLLTSFTQRYGYMRKHLLRPTWGLGATVAMVVAMMIFTGYFVHYTNQESEKARVNNATVMKALRPLGQGCPMTVLRGDDINVKNILNSGISVDIILQINRVSSMNELLQKDEVIACSNR